jgi:hypothetical protein
MEMTDGTHWADVFLAGGVLTTYSMSRKTTENGMFRKTNSVSIAARTTVVATKCGSRGKTLSLDAKARPCLWKGYCRGQLLATDRVADANAKPGSIRNER